MAWFRLPISQYHFSLWIQKLHFSNTHNFMVKSPWNSMSLKEKLNWTISFVISSDASCTNIGTCILLPSPHQRDVMHFYHVWISSHIVRTLLFFLLLIYFAVLILVLFIVKLYSLEKKFLLGAIIELCKEAWKKSSYISFKDTEYLLRGIEAICMFLSHKMFHLWWDLKLLFINIFHRLPHCTLNFCYGNRKLLLWLFCDVLLIVQQDFVKAKVVSYFFSFEGRDNIKLSKN